MKNLINDTARPQLLNVQVTAIPKIGTNGKVNYETTFTPESLKVTEPDTIINYQLIDPTPSDVRFKSLSIKPDDSDQFSIPSISGSGKLVTFSDANTAKAKFNISIKFTDKDQQEFIVDPEVDNDPKRLTAEPLKMVMLEPEPDNDPKR